MAYPTYVSYKSDYDSSSTTTHTITWPSGVTNGNLLYGVFATRDYGENWSSGGVTKTDNITYIQYEGYDVGGYHIRMFVFFGLAATTNTLVLTSPMSVIGRWIVYEFSDHNLPYPTASGFFGLAGEIFWENSGTHFDCPICPTPAYYGSHDYTWLTFVCYNSSSTFTCPTDFSNQINNIRTSTEFEVSIAAARRNYATEQLDPGNWDTGIASAMDYGSYTVRIPPGIYPEDTPSGFGFIVPSSNVDLP
jgi:hypothetical protein